MMERMVVKSVGLVMLAMAIVVEGMMLGRVQGSAPVSVITTGDVAAVLSDIGFPGDEGEEAQEIIVEDAKPGDVIEREPRVCVSEGSSRAYLRARILASDLKRQQADELLAGLEQSGDWNFNPQDGYYYYKDPVTASQQISVFESIHIPGNWDGPENFRLHVTVELVEASRLTPRIDSECRTTGWIDAEKD